MKYAFVKIEKLSETLGLLAGMNGDMLPIRAEVDPDHFARAMGEQRLKQVQETGVLANGVPVSFVKLPFCSIKLIIADDIMNHDLAKKHPEFVEKLDRESFDADTDSKWETSNDRPSRTYLFHRPPQRMRLGWTRLRPITAGRRTRTLSRLP
jgi:hypothetical protein